VHRFFGIFFNPKVTLSAISQKPIWIDVLVILLITTSLFSYLIMPSSSQDRAQILKDNIKLKERIGEERLKQRIEELENPSPTFRVVSSFILTPLSVAIGFLISSFFILIIGRFFSIEGKYIQVFSAYLHANLVDKVLGNLIRLILILAQKSVMQTTTSFALLFPAVEMTSIKYVILSQIDFFQIWLFLILGFGLSEILRLEIKKALYVSYLFWLLKTLFYMSLGILGLRLMS